MARRILVTGASGFLGRHLMPVLRETYPNDLVTGVRASDYDLMDIGAVREMFDAVRPDVVVHLAAYSGGIGANKTFPADFYYRNVVLTAHVFEEAAKRKIEKLVYPMGGCSYPANAESPIDETQLWKGYPQAESAGYSTAKMMGTVAARSYSAQYGLKAVVIIPGNLYGEYDNFSKLDSHVVPAMIRRYYEAKLGGLDEVMMWGTGRPRRDLVYAADVAAAIPYFIDTYESTEPVNISAGDSVTIKELAETVAELVDFRGKISWDSDKPDGQMIKIFDVKKLNSLGLSCDTPLGDGLRKTIDWFSRHYADHSDGLRL